MLSKIYTIKEIRELLNILNVSQGKLAEMCNCDRTAINVWLIDPKNNILVQQKTEQNKDFPYFTKVLGVYLREAP